MNIFVKWSSIFILCLFLGVVFEGIDALVSLEEAFSITHGLTWGAGLFVGVMLIAGGKAFLSRKDM